MVLVTRHDFSGVSMRFALAIAAILAVALPPAGPARSETPPDEPMVTQDRDPVAAEVVRRLTERAGTAEDEIEAAWLSELTGVYAAPGAKPLWTSHTGITARGEEIVRACQSADAYGLDPAEFDLPLSSDTPAEAELKLSLAAVKYIWHARGGRIDPSQLSLWLDQTPRTVYASTAVRELAAAEDPGAAMRAAHPHHPHFEALRQGLLRARGLLPEEKPQPITPGSKIVKGDRHIDVALVRKHLGISADPGNETLADEELITAVRNFMRQAGYGKKKWYIDDDVRTAINAAAHNRKPADNKALAEKILINMERWRWLPREFGALHVWNNIPEFESRVVKGGEVVHRERIIVGQPHTQTPVFSDAMSQIIFQPTWALPPSIKLHQFGSRAGPGIADVLARRNMRIVDDDGTVIRATRIRWGKVDIRHVPIVQGPGPGNPLGRLKFVFPNAHAVYMHDTPDKYLFNSSERTFSHGCMRLRNPEKYAEVILGLTRGWTAADVAKNLTYKDTIKVSLPEHIPVHVTYFTVVPDGSAGLRSLKDVYGHDKRIADAFAGVPYAKIAARDPALAQLRQNEELARKARSLPSKRQKASIQSAARRAKPGNTRSAQAKPKPTSGFFIFKPQGGG